MSVLTLEGVVKEGRIRLLDDIQLPENTQVYVIVPNLEPAPIARIYSPRLAHPEQIEEFKMEVIEENPDADLQ